MISKLKNVFYKEYKTHNRFLKDTSYIIILRGLEIILGLAATYFVVRALSKETFGEYHFILSCIGIISIFSLKSEYCGHIGRSNSTFAVKAWEAHVHRVLHAFEVLGGAL